MGIVWVCSRNEELGVLELEIDDKVEDLLVEEGFKAVGEWVYFEILRNMECCY